MSNENKVENMDSAQARGGPKPVQQQQEEQPQQGSNSRGDGDNLAENIPRDKQAKDKNNAAVIQDLDNESLNNLLQYDSDSSSTSSEIEMSFNWQNAQDESDSSSSSSDDDDEEDDDDDTSSGDDDVSVIDTTPQGAIKKDIAVPKVLRESSLDDLPPVPDLSTLTINHEDEKFEHMGNVLGVVDRLVTVNSLPDKPAYDLDTLLFIDGGKRPLGFVFDVLGRVDAPIYAVRFNSVDDISSLEITKGTKVYSAPKSKHTQYVFLQQLLNIKGSDASWVGDTEPPEEYAEYSDDEAEFMTKTNKLTRQLSSGSSTSSSDSYKRFESTMNKRNILNTKFNKYMDSYKQARLIKSTKAKHRSSAYNGTFYLQHHRNSQQQHQQALPVTPPAASALPPQFDPTVPPPKMYVPGPMGYPRPQHYPVFYGNELMLGRSPPPFTPPLPSVTAPPVASNFNVNVPNFVPAAYPAPPGFGAPPHPFVVPSSGGDNNNRLFQQQLAGSSTNPATPPTGGNPPLNYISSNFIGAPGNSTTGVQANYFTNNARGPRDRAGPSHQ